MQENRKSGLWTEHWLFYVITTAVIAFAGIALGKFTIGFLISMILNLISGFYPALNDGIIEVMTHNFCFLMIIFLLKLYVQKREKKGICQLWLTGSGNKIPTFLAGVAAGFLLCIASVLVALLWTDWKLSFQSVDVVVIGLVLLSAVIQAGVEEILFRGYLLHGLRKRYSTVFSIVLSGIIFSVTHCMNPGIGVLAVANITLFGITLSYLAVKWNSLFLVTGIHFMWNFTEEIILGTPNSGIVFPKSIFVLTGGGDSVFYNPTFGIEAAVQTFAFWGMLLLFAILRRKYVE